MYDVIWTRSSFINFLAKMGGLLKFLLIIARIIMSSYEQFVQETFLLRNLYGERDESDDEDDGDEPLQQSYSELRPKAVFKKKLEARKEFSFNYCVYVLFGCCCCFTVCFVKCCGPKSWIAKKNESFHKF